MVTHSRVLAWRIPWTEEPGGLQSTGSHRVRRGGSDSARTPAAHGTCRILQFASSVPTILSDLFSSRYPHTVYSFKQR